MEALDDCRFALVVKSNLGGPSHASADTRVKLFHVANIAALKRQDSKVVLRR